MVAKMNGTTEDEEIRRPQSRILDPIRRKKLMKKLEKMKLNRSRGNNSFFDISALYESKVRKLKNNNISLAKALAEQRQVSQTWYGEVVSLKEEMQETHEHLLRYRLNEPGNSDAAIQAAAERRIKEIAGPLEFAVQDSLDNVFGLVESMTKVKKLLASLLKINNEKLNYSVRSSRSSGGSRPPLSRTSKSPRKNVVHPMVEGHVLQPASIHIPRMSLEERRRYRLQERAELRQEEDMSVIGEVSVVLSEEEPSRENSLIEAEPVEPENSSATLPLPEEALPSPTPSPASIPIVTAEDLMPRPSPEDEPPRRSFPSSKKGKRQIGVLDSEDPLEGSSWMNTKKRRSSKKKGRSSGGAKRSNPFLLPYIVPSDSEDEIEPPEVLRSSSPKRDLENREDSSFNSSLDKSLPTLCLVRLEEFESKVSRRSKKSTTSRASKASRCSRVSDEAENFDVPIPLQSFIINDTLRNTSFESPESQALLDQNFNTFSTPTTPSSQPPLEEEAEDVTCLFDSSMEMTQCVSVGLQTAHEASSNHCAEDDDQLKPVRYSKNTNRFFKGFEKEASSPKDFGRTPYDLSMMDASAMDVLKKGKENIPPLGEAVSPEASMKLRDVSIVVEDIMKTSLTPELPPRGTGGDPPQGEAESPLQSSPVKKKRGRKPLKKICLAEGGVGAKTPPPVAKGRKKAKKEIPKAKAKRSAKLQDPLFDPLDQNVCDPTEERLEQEEPSPGRATSSTPLPEDDVQFSSLTESHFPQRDQPQEEDLVEALMMVSPIPEEDVMETPRASPTPQDDPFDLPDLMLPFEEEEAAAAAAASDNSDAEGSVKGRPSRRAASKIASFKEPSLILKLRQDKTGKKNVKTTRKKSSQKHIPVQS